MSLILLAWLRPDVALAHEGGAQFLQTPFESFDQATAAFSQNALVPCYAMSATRDPNAPDRLTVSSRRMMAIRGEALVRFAMPQEEIPNATPAAEPEAIAAADPAPSPVPEADPAA